MGANAAPLQDDVYLRFNGVDNYIEIPSTADYSIAATGFANGLVAEFLLNADTGATATNSVQPNDGAIVGATWDVQG